ncbi:MAG: hypothetical protein NT069_24730 [Planctomycetota bacterium]|nr:hypothetical protein [Planctomycetota bacterium]
MSRHGGRGERWRRRGRPDEGLGNFGSRTLEEDRDVPEEQGRTQVDRGMAASNERTGEGDPNGVP